MVGVTAILTLAHCNTTDRTRRAYLRANVAALGAPQRPIIVIAGFSVTRLVDPVTGDHVWGTPRSVWRTEHPDDLDLDPDDRLVARGWVGSRGPINTGWQLSAGLRKFGGYTADVDLHPFHYDWRRSARDNARLLGDLVARVRNGGKVDLVTHSAGALVALAYSGEHVENIVMVAPPRHGVVDAFRIFVQPERFIRRTFDAAIVATWPSIFELLPSEGRVFVDERGRALERDLWDASWWPVDVRAQLMAARAFRDELEEKQSCFSFALDQTTRTRSAACPPLPHPPPKVTVLAGDCVPTARRILARADGTYAFYPKQLRPHEQHLAAALFEPGDGTVPASAAGPAMLFCDGHQGIAADPSVHRAMIRALRF